MLHAVIFDMDGLLADTEWPDYLAWQELFRQHGGDLTLEEWVGEVGVWGATSVKARFSTLRGTTDGLETLYAARRLRYRELVAEISLLPGVAALLAALAASGVPCGVASSSDRDWVSFVLDTLGVREQMAAVVTGDDVAARKPAPDVYLAAAARLGAAPAECVAIEDSAVGVAAAVAAGIRCIAVPNRLTRHHDLSEAHALFATLADVDPACLAALLV